MALVVAIAGMIFPAYSTSRDDVRLRPIRHKDHTLTLDLETGLTPDVESCGAQIGSSDDEVESIIIVLVKRQRRGSGRINALRQAFDTRERWLQLGHTGQKQRTRFYLETKSS